jgi:hypothetical protein
MANQLFDQGRNGFAVGSFNEEWTFHVDTSHIFNL